MVIARLFAIRPDNVLLARAQFGVPTGMVHRAEIMVRSPQIAMVH